MVCAVPADMQDNVKIMADMIAKKFPYETLAGFVDDYHFNMFYNLKPPLWINDALIRALCDRICSQHPTVRFGGMPRGQLSGGKAQLTHAVEDDIVSRISVWIGDGSGSVTSILLPVNFGNNHWCCLIVDVAAKAVRYYDSLNNRSYKSALDKMSKNIIERVAPTYSAVSLNSPIQFDSYSCGLFVCFKMWRHVDSNISTNMRDYGLGARRFELLRYVFEGVGPHANYCPASETWE
ncbi:hypothetical protein PINS_up018264 [Pythium insidiosum]|nr:hypothetical protein PINS_up018264 [Pythium insidiosum]